MTAIERRQLILQRLMMVNDENVLKDVEHILDQYQTDGTLFFSSELREKLDDALEQMEKGQVFAMDEVKQRLERWNVK